MADSSQSSSSVPDQICTVCMEQMINPKTLPCLHSFCGKCLEPLLLTQEDGTGILGCPTCRFPVSVPVEGIQGLPQASSTLSLTESSVGYTSNSKEGMSNCAKHKQVMKLYCETCEECVCNMCAIDDHHDHQYYMMTRKFQQLLEQVQNELGPVQTKLEALDENVEKIEVRQREIRSRGESLIDEIHSLSERLVKNIQESEASLVKQLEDAIKSKTSLLEQQKEFTKAVLTRVKDCQANIEEQIQAKKPHLLFQHKKAILADIDHVKRIDSTIYEPCELNDIRFNGNGTLLYHCKELGKVTGSHVYQLCSPVTVPPQGRKRVQAGINTCFEFTATYPDGTPVSLPSSLFTGSLTTPTSGDPISFPVTETGKGTHQINYTPVVSGRYQLRIQLGGKELANSPFEITVTPSAGIGGKSIHIIPELQFPWGVAISKDEQLIAVAETGKHCIGLFNKDGQRVGTIGSKGKEDGRFTNPRGIAITETSHIIVSDYERIQKLNRSGTCIRALCGHGKGPLQFADPKGLTVHKPTGKILVADSNNHRIQVLNADLTFSHSFGKQGKMDGEFQFPWDVACDSHDDVFIVDNENHLIHKFTLDGKFLLKFGGKGEEPGKLSWPSGIAVDHNDMIYVTDDNQAISIFENNGTFVKRIKENKGRTGFKHPIGVMVDSSGCTYVCDCWNSRVIILPELN